MSGAEKTAALAVAAKRALGCDCADISACGGEVCVYVEAERIKETIIKLRDDPDICMSQLMDICAADYPARKKRFDVVYVLLGIRLNQRIRVKICVGEETSVPSVAGVFSSAGWHEREVWDMFGIKFSGNPDMRRILTEYDFEGHPLRKDFPLTGFAEIRYDNKQGKIVREPLNLETKHREYDFSSPWRGRA